MTGVKGSKMRTAADWADWWDQQHKESKEFFLQFAADNPNLFGIVVSAAFNTAMDLAAGTVDMLRFGKGIAEGGAKGYAKDALRLIGLVGTTAPLTKVARPLNGVAQFAQRAVNARLARVLVDDGGGICSWVAGARALRHTGTRAFATVDDLAQAMNTTRLGVELSEVRSLEQALIPLRRLGATPGPVTRVSNFLDVQRMVPKDGGVVMFVVRGSFRSATNPAALEESAHAGYAFRDLMGRIRIMDRGQGQLGVIYNSYGEFTSAWHRTYGLDGGWGPYTAAVIPSVLVKITNEGLKATGVLAMEILAVAGKDKSDRETVAQAFEVYKNAKNGTMRTGVVRDGVMISHPVLVKNPGTPYTTVNGDTLERIAKKFYGKESKWPVIYTANRDVIGDDPGKLRVNQNLIVPELPQVRGIK